MTKRMAVAATALLTVLLAGCCGSMAGLSDKSRAGENQYFADIIAYGGTDYSVYSAPGLVTLPFAHERFAILDGTVYYTAAREMRERQTGEKAEAAAVGAEAAAVGAGEAAVGAEAAAAEMAAILAGGMDGSGAREIAGDLADPENPQILIGDGRLVYGFQNGDFKGLASVDLKDQTRRQLAVKYQDGLRLLGIDGDRLYIRQMAEAAGQGRDGQGNFFCESMPVQEVIWYDLGTTESRDVVSFPGENSVDGVSGLSMADGVLYYWQQERMEEGAAQKRFRFCSLKDHTYVNYPVFGDGGAYAVSEGRVYFVDNGAVFSYPLGTEEDWGRVEGVYGNRVYQPGNSGSSPSCRRRRGGWTE